MKFRVFYLFNSAPNQIAVIPRGMVMVLLDGCVVLPFQSFRSRLTLVWFEYAVRIALICHLYQKSLYCNATKFHFVWIRADYMCSPTDTIEYDDRVYLPMSPQNLCRNFLKLRNIFDLSLSVQCPSHCICESKNCY